MIEKISFQHTENGFKTAAFEQRLVEGATDQATSWINSCDGQIKVLDVSLALGNVSAVAVVWYERI